MTVSIRPGKYTAAVMEIEPNGERLQTGWFRRLPPGDMLEWAIRHAAEDHPRLRVLYLLHAHVAKPLIVAADPATPKDQGEGT